MQDIAPQLLEAVLKAFQQNLNKNSRIKDLQKKLLSAKNLNGNEAELYSVEVGQALAKAFQDEINADTLPDGRMYYNIASRVIPPPMQKCYVDIADYAQAMYKGLNERAGLGLKAQRAKYNEDRVKGLIEYACGADRYVDRQKNFEGSLVNYAQSVATDTTKANAEFHYNAGLSPVIRRIANAGCCKWCANLAGTYDYPIDFAYDKDPYPRHRDCRCQVLYDPGDGKVQNVHTKRWETARPEDRIRRVMEKQLQSPMLYTYEDPIREILGAAEESHPEMLEAFLEELEQNGVDVSRRPNAMGYSPNPTPGKPGQIIMEEGASISAWMHEMQHFHDDKMAGFPGFRIFETPTKAAEFERRGYEVEIDFARKNGYNDVARRLEELMNIRLGELLK